MLSDAPQRTVDVQAYLADARRLAVDEIRRLVPTDHACGPVLYDLMLEYPLREAKGLRPALCIATARALGGSLEATLPSAAILELYHNAFLIHDDVEDGSEQRRAGPTLHRDHGAPIAINVADGMLALALSPLLDNTRVVGLGRALRIIQIIARMARETAEGQAIELGWIRNGDWALSDADYERMVLKKTGWYSFVAPVVIGAIIAGAADGRIEALAEMARELAIAFQIRDDVLNLGAAGPYGKETNGDLWEGKRTLILLHMLRSLPCALADEARAILNRPRPLLGAWNDRLEELVATGDLTPRGRERLRVVTETAKSEADIAKLLSWIDETRGLEYARDVAADHARRAHDALKRAELRPSAHHELLYALVEFTTVREH